MGRSHLFEAIVLRTVDTGEADRFCVLFTRERGRLAAAAKGARRAGSRLAALLQPAHLLTVQCTEGSSGYLITSATESEHAPRRDLSEFLNGQVFSELLLQLTEDEDPMPEVFSLLQNALREGFPDDNALLIFKVRLMEVLGLLPLTVQDTRFAALSNEARRWLEDCAGHQPLSIVVPSGIATFTKTILEEHLRWPLKSEKVRSELLHA